METRNGLYLDKGKQPLSILEGRGWYPSENLYYLFAVKHSWPLALGNEQVRVGATLIMPMELML